MITRLIFVLLLFYINISTIISVGDESQKGISSHQESNSQISEGTSYTSTIKPVSQSNIPSSNITTNTNTSIINDHEGKLNKLVDKVQSLEGKIEKLESEKANTNKKESYMNILENVQSIKTPLILCGTSNIPLCEGIAHHLSQPLGKITIKTFKDDEISIDIHEEIMNRNVFIIQSTNTPVNDNLMELLLLISTCKSYGARSITAIIPYFGYSRQDKKTTTTSPVSANAVSNLIKNSGVNTVITVDIHSLHTLSFFEPNILSFNIDTHEFISKEFINLNINNPVIISPDIGGVVRARAFKDFINKHGLPCNDMGIIIKHRTCPNQVNEMVLFGDVKNRNVIIVDDMIDTAGTLDLAAKTLKDHGANNIICFATHGIFSTTAYDIIDSSPIDAIYTTDSIFRRNQSDKIKTISIAPLISNVISQMLD